RHWRPVRPELQYPRAVGAADTEETGRWRANNLQRPSQCSVRPIIVYTLPLHHFLCTIDEVSVLGRRMTSRSAHGRLPSNRQELVSVAWREGGSGDVYATSWTTEKKSSGGWVIVADNGLEPNDFSVFLPVCDHCFPNTNIEEF
ncbi:hypothetical protein WA026_007659, partial [Henosepilachna vigintioctopunctata]